MEITVKNNDWLKLGLIAMSKSTELGFWLHGHIGALVLTNFFFVDELSHDPLLEQAIIKQTNKVIKENIQFFEDPFKDNLPKEPVTEIEKCLKKSLSQLSTAGHGVIFATLTLKAINALDGGLPDNITKGLIALIKNTHKDHPHRYFDNYDYQNQDINFDNIPVFNTVYDAAKYCLGNQSELYLNQEIEGKNYFFHGNKLHDITHAHALVMLDKMGYHELAQSGIRELRKQIKLSDVAPPNGKRHKATSKLNPFDVSFWERDANDEHHYKLAYSLCSLFSILKDIDEDLILEKVSGHWELLD